MKRTQDVVPCWRECPKQTNPVPPFSVTFVTCLFVMRLPLPSNDDIQTARVRRAAVHFDQSETCLTNPLEMKIAFGISPGILLFFALAKSTRKQ